MKNTFISGALVAVAVAALTFAGPVMAQESTQSGQSGQSDTRTSGSNESGRSDSSNLGWLGLAGLAGLAGLRKPAPTVVHQDKDTVAKAY